MLETSLDVFPGSVNIFGRRDSDELPKPFKVRNVPVLPGAVIIFRDDLFHRGVANKGDSWHFRLHMSWRSLAVRHIPYSTYPLDSLDEAMRNWFILN